MAVTEVDVIWVVRQPAARVPLTPAAFALLGTVSILALIGLAWAGPAWASQAEALPAPDRTGQAALETLLQSRQSARAFADEPLSRPVLGQLLWATGGTTLEDRFMHRTVPSAGALYPLEAYVATAEGLARYDPAAHALVWLGKPDLRAALSAAALGQVWMAQAPAVIVIAAEPQRTKVKYGERGDRYVFMEAGFACQNLLLQATALGLVGVPVGAFDDADVARVLGLPSDQRALLIVPVGAARGRE